MRRAVFLVLLAACGFEHGASTSPASGEPDAPTPVKIDAAIDAPPDSPTAACPDDDADGICNDVDDWPCGAKPAAAPASVAWTANGGATSVTITPTSINGTGVYAVAAASTFINYSIGLVITDTACSSACDDQIEVGWVPPGTRSGCVFDQAVNKQNGVSGTLTGTIRTPSTTGEHDLRVNLGQNYTCTSGGATGWWGGVTPGDNRTIAKLCVH